MRSGLLRHKVQLQKPAKSRDSYGGESVTWTSDSALWVQIHPMRGDEYFDAQNVQSKATHKIRMRYQTLSSGGELHPQCRIKHGSRYFYFAGPPINVEERDRMLEVLCWEST